MQVPENRRTLSREEAIEIVNTYLVKELEIVGNRHQLAFNAVTKRFPNTPINERHRLADKWLKEASNSF